MRGIEGSKVNPGPALNNQQQLGDYPEQRLGGYPEQILEPATTNPHPEIEPQPETT
jgi:hypothetical protein